jgi:hypothetical protein
MEEEIMIAYNQEFDPPAPMLEASVAHVQMPPALDCLL